MIVTMFLTREEFAAKRRKAQDDAVDVLRSAIKDYIARGDDLDKVLELAATVFADNYKAESGNEWEKGLPTKIATSIRSLFSHLKQDSDVEATSLAVASMLINEAAMQAAIDDEDELFLEWVTMHDTHVRQAHKDTDGQVRPAGEKFDVDGVAMAFPGDVAAPIELWINCRCTLRPTMANASVGQSVEFDDDSTETLAAEFISEKPWNGSASRFTPEQWKASCILHVCDGMEKSCHKLPIKEPGGQLSRAGVHAAAGRLNQVDAPAAAKAAAKSRLRGAYKQLGEEPPDSLKASVRDAAGMIIHTGPMTDTISGGSWSTTSGQLWTTTTSSDGVMVLQPVEAAKDDDRDEALQRLADMTPDEQSALEGLVPWHGVLAPEDKRSGDGRMFATDSLSHRDLPLPLTYQKAQDSGHDGSVVVGSIETIERVDGMMHASGWFLSTPEADEVIGLVAHFGKYGVSVDADDAEFDYDEEAGSVTFTKARICSASLVSIPAFSEAYVALGPWDDSDVDGMAASAYTEEFVKTEDGPGWLTHPVDTERLRHYWVHGPGAAKIGWGTPGDFNRCRLNLAKYVKPQYLSGYCANRHYDALGFWPGRPVSGDTIPLVEDGIAAAALSLVASAAPEQYTAPAEWFADPEFTKPTHLTVSADGRVFGHAAEWGVCHIGIQGVCTEAPKSLTGYSAFANKAVLLDDGSFARTGVIHLGGKHARGGRVSPAVVTQHYDDTSRAVADVSIGEDEFGIWVAGWVRPGTSPEDVAALRGSDISGDWREMTRFANDLEMVALLAVNAGGFPVKVSASNGKMVSLCAAGMVQGEEEPSQTDRIAEAIAKALERVEHNKVQRTATMKSLRDKHVPRDGKEES